MRMHKEESTTYKHTNKTKEIAETEKISTFFSVRYNKF